MFDFEFGFEMKQGMVWEISGQILRGFWLITYTGSMLDCHVIKKLKKGKKYNKE